MRRLGVVIILLLVMVGGRASAQEPTPTPPSEITLPAPFVGFQAVWFGDELAYQQGGYPRAFLAVRDGYEVVQVDFFPPETDPPCIWIRSRLEPVFEDQPVTDMRMDYCGGIGWRHFIVEPNFDIYYRWTLSMGLPNEGPIDQLAFFVRES